MAASMSKPAEQGSGSNALADTKPEAQSPDFDFCEFFHGHTRVSGWFSDRFGVPKRHFCGDFYGYYDETGFLLDEKLYYTDGVFESRTWKIDVSDNGVFTAESDSLIDGARGVVAGNTLSMRYLMNVKIAQDKYWKLAMKDTMILQPDGSLHNITHVYKWGLRIGTVSSQYLHHDGSKLCSSDIGIDTPSTASARGKADRVLSSV